MFIGHFAVGFGAKPLAPRVSLGVLLAAPLFLDLVWPIFVLAGWEEVRIAPGDTPFTPLEFVSYPFTHSLLTCLTWALAFALVYWARTRYGRGAVVLFAGVLSHWFFDVLVHRPDLPLFPGGPKVGLGLWNSVAATVVVEGLLFVIGVALYARATRARDRAGVLGFRSFAGLLVALYAANLAGPPPPSASAVATVSLAGWLFPVWAWWLDRHRCPRSILPTAAAVTGDERD